MSDRPLPPVQNEIPVAGRLITWAIYDSPNDRPGKFVARAFACDQGPEPVPLLMSFEADNILDVRRALRARGLVLLMTRLPTDHPNVVETWI